jgi:predicted RNase H-like HicB family nuclease
VVTESDGWLVGVVREITGAASQGRTLEELRENLQDAAREVIASQIEEVENESSLGKLLEVPL